MSVCRRLPDPGSQTGDCRWSPYSFNATPVINPSHIMPGFAEWNRLRRLGMFWAVLACCLFLPVLDFFSLLTTKSISFSANR